MTQQDKEVLLKDLCARLPYGVKFQYVDIVTTLIAITFDSKGKHLMNGFLLDKCTFFLRPMSSMTEKEKKEIAIAFNYKYSHVNTLEIISDDWGKSYAELLGFLSVRFIHMANVIDYFNAHHFDYRGLIEKGLALEAPENMYKEH